MHAVYGHRSRYGHQSLPPTPHTGRRICLFVLNNNIFPAAKRPRHAPLADGAVPAEAEAEAASNGGGGAGLSSDTEAEAVVATVTGKRTDFLVWDDYFMSVAFLSAMRSKDPSTQVGAW